MKEQTLVKMQHDLKLTQQALVVALNKIEVIEKKLKEKEQMLKNCLYLQKQYNDIRRTLLQVYDRPRITKSDKYTRIS